MTDPLEPQPLAYQKEKVDPNEAHKAIFGEESILNDAYDIVYKHKNRCLCLDTETTGMSPEAGHRIIEIGMVEVDNFYIDPVEEHHYRQFVNPEREVPEDAVKIHGITTDFLMTKPRFADIADDFIERIRGNVLVIHNAEFDVKFLNYELELCGKPKIEELCEVIDTMKIGVAMFPGRQMNLDNLCRLNGVIGERPFHGALLDSLLLAECWVAMTRGQQAFNVEKLLYKEALPYKDLSKLIYSQPSQEELKEHSRILDLVEKDCKGTALWRSVYGDERNVERKENA